MQSLAFFAALATALAPAALGVQDPAALVPTPYFPAKVGTTWHYRNGTQKIVVKVTAHEKVGEVLAARLEATEKSTTRTEYISLTSDGVYRTKIKDGELTPPLCIFKLPPEKEESWRVDCTVGSTKIRGTFLSEEESVTVPAGQFQTVKVTSKDFRIGDRPTPLTYWFAKGTGIVKQRMEIAGFDLVLELEKFDAP